MRVSGIPFVQGRNAYADADGTKYAIAIHNTSNDATAADEAAYATRRTDGTSSHFYVDSSTIIQSLDTDDRAGHAGSRQGNEHAISFEIMGFNHWKRERWIKSVAWDKLGMVCATICKRYGIPVQRISPNVMRQNPKVRGFYSHDDMRLAWGGTTHTDPGPNFPWDILFSSVNRYMKEDDFVMTADEFAALLSNPKVYKILAAAPWNQEVGRSNKSTHDVLFGEMREILNSAVDRDPITGIDVATLETVVEKVVRRVLGTLDESATP